MKFNTTKAASFNKNSPNSLLNDNKFIPEDHKQDDNNNNDEGRTLFYETILVATPVLASARVADHTKTTSTTTSPSRRALLVSSQVDELGDLLDSLRIGRSSGGPAISPTAVPQRVLSAVVQPNVVVDVRPLGRCATKIGQHPQTQQPQTVLRSARLQQKLQ